MNSINWARVMAQIVYYVTTVARLGRCSFTVPTGNRQHLLRVDRRAHGPADRPARDRSNSNDILTRWAIDGSLIARPVVPTYSLSMDIQVSSNHERLLFELGGRDGGRTAELLDRFRAVGRWRPRTTTGSRPPHSTTPRASRSSARCTAPPVLVDPHTAVGIGAARVPHR